MKRVIAIVILSLVILSLVAGVIIFWYYEKKSTDELLKTTKDYIEKREKEYNQALEKAGIKIITKETIKYITKEQEDELLLTVDRQRSEFKNKFEDASKDLAKSIKRIDLAPWVYGGFNYNKDTEKFGVDVIVGTDLRFWIYNNFFIPNNTVAFDVGLAVKLYDNIGVGAKFGFTIKIK